MKNIFKKLLWMMVVIVCSTMGVLAQEYHDSFNDKAQWIEAYIRKEKGGIKKFQQMTLMVRKSDNQFVYCIEAGVAINSTTVMTGTDINQKEATGMTEEQWKRVSALAYYGYGYGTHTDIKWYTVTQFLIWNTVPNGYDIYFTDTLNGKRITKYTEEIKELESLVASHQKTPEFNEKNIVLNLGEEITLEDNEGVLNLYDISSSDIVDVDKNGNSLTIRAKKSGKDTLTFTKREKNMSHPMIVYTNPTIQDVLVRGAYDDVTANIDVEVRTGSVLVEKKDQDTKTNQSLSPNATLEGAVYGIYKENGEKITTITTNKDGNANYIELDSLGRYYILEEKAPTGYLIDTNKYYFEVTKENPNPTIVVYENVIKAKLKITKVLGSTKTGILDPEAGAEFGIYNEKGEQYTTAQTDKQGKLEVTLPYGKWEVRQLTTTSGYEKMQNFKIEVTNEEAHEYVIVDGEINAKLKVNKVDSETGQIIPKANIQFKIKNKDTNQYVCQNITYPTPEEICIYQTDETGTLITPEVLPQGSYQLEEVDQKIDGYLWNQEPIDFEIKDANLLEMTEKYGLILEINFKNTPVKGSVEIMKYGEEVVLENESFSYQKKKLDNVLFELYAKEDIFLGDGTKVYQKDEKIMQFKTKDGSYKIEDLPLGKYYLKEIETEENHQLMDEPYEFSIEYKDQYTEEVVVKIELENKQKKGKLIISKVDEETKEALSDTKLAIFKEDGTKIYEGVTNENGQIILPDLFLGNFYLQEIESKKGYLKKEDKIPFSLSENQEEVPIVLTNRKLVEIPRTDTKLSYTKMASTLFITISGLGMIIYAKKK